MKFSEHRSTRIKYFISFLLWGYIIYRASFLPITQDEAHSYLLAKTDNWRQMAGTTNTHWFNTLFLRLMLFFPGEDAMWKLRLLSMLSWSIYSWSAIRISDGIFDKWLGFVFFLALVLNPFILFYFSLERGYAPALALDLLALYLFSVRIRDHEFRPEKWASVFFIAALASLANFSAFYFFMALTTFFVVYLAVTKRLNSLLKASAWPVWLIITAITAFTATALFFVRSRNELYYGGTNLTASMIGSMLQGSCYIGSHYRLYETEGVRALLSMEVPLLYHFLAFALFVAFVLVFLWLGYRLIQSGKCSFPFAIISIFLLMLLINGLLNLLFNTPYLFSRTALVLYPVMITAVFGLLHETCSPKLSQRVLTGSFVLFLVYNFYKSFSLQTFVEWPVQTNTKATLDYLQQNNAENVGLNLWDYSLLANYFSKAYPGKYTFHYAVLPDNRNREPIGLELLKSFDYIVLSPPADSTILRTWRIQAITPISKTVILKAP